MLNYLKQQINALSLPEITITYLWKGFSYEPHLISFSFWDLNVGVGAILCVEKLTLISQNCLRVE